MFDVYATILELGPPPPNAAEGWQTLGKETWGRPANLGLSTFDETCRRIIAREHSVAHQNGIRHPEIYWPAIAQEALPELAALPPAELDCFLWQHAQLQRRIQLMNGAAECLRRLRDTGLLLGIASNSQPYTLRELRTVLQRHALSLDLFPPELCFWSFQAGFSKPDPHVFRFLTVRLQARGVRPPETLMVGDRIDNDIEPASSQGWQTWQLTASERPDHPGGSWADLANCLRLG